MTIRAVAAFLLLIVPVSAAAQPSGGGNLSDRQFAAIGHGVSLSLIIPGTTFPRNALVQVMVRLRNVSRRPIMLDTSCGTSLSVEVFNAAGKPVPQGVRGPSCTPPFLMTLAPGGTLQRKVYVVLRGRHLRASALLRPTDADVEMMGRRRTVRLTRGRPPRLVVHTANRVSADISPGDAEQRGPLLYTALDYCAGGAGPGSGTGRETQTWTVARKYVHGSYHFKPQCRHPKVWLLVAGWLNQPVVLINYRT